MLEDHAAKIRREREPHLVPHVHDRPRLTGPLESCLEFNIDLLRVLEIILTAAFAQWRNLRMLNVDHVSA